jgi:hypothetical protein
MSAKRVDNGEFVQQVDLFNDGSLKAEAEESADRIKYTNEEVDQLQRDKHAPVARFRIRVYPFSKNSSFETIEPNEIQALAYVQKILPWLKAKPKPIHVLVEKDDVVWRLWSNEGGAWEEERLHGEG